MSHRLLIRADADAAYGFGHVMRTLAMAQFWRDEIGPVTYCSCQISNELMERLRSESIELIGPVEFGGAERGSMEDAQITLQAAKQLRAASIVMDGYCFDDSFQQAVYLGIQSQSPANDRRPVSVLIDDDGRFAAYHVDLLLNQNVGADQHLYAGKMLVASELLLGSPYTLLRKEFLDHKVNPGSNDERRLLITLGGYDPGGVTQQIIDALELLSPENLRIKLISRVKGLRIDEAWIDLVEFTSDMAELYSKADLAICAGGSTNWELSYFGVPRLIVVLANNQRLIAEELSARNCARSLGWFASLDVGLIASQLSALLELDPTTFESIKHNNRQLIDGQGAERVARHLVALIEKPR